MSVTERVIFEQFPFWRSALKLDLPGLPKKTIVFVGCGTSYYLAQTLAAAFNLVGRDTVAVPGSEWIARRQAYVGARTDLCVVGLSRSGDFDRDRAGAGRKRQGGLRHGRHNLRAGQRDHPGDG